MTESTKRCVTCKLSKPLSAFSKWARGKDGLQARCKQCAASYYARNRARIYPLIREREARVIKEGQRFLWDYLSCNPCVDCGESDPLVLDFDHVQGVKRDHVSRMAVEGFSIRLLQTEIAKCAVRCANCHRRKTAKEFGWYRALLAAEVAG